MWGARADRLDRPDLVVFDLDPDPDLPWRSTAETAQLLRALLEDLGLVSFARSTGGKGHSRRLAAGATGELARRSPFATHPHA